MATSHRHALVVEDDDDIRELLRDILEGAGSSSRRPLMV